MANNTRRISILGAGGNAGVLLSRCLRADARFEVVGWDDNPWARKLIECNVDEQARGTDADLIIPTPDSLVLLYADKPGTFLPAKSVIETCQSKALTAKLLGPVLCPETYWVRETSGAGGAGARQEMASQYLPGRNISVELVYCTGVVWGHFVKERLSYSVKCIEPNVVGIGTSMVSRCIEAPEYVDLAKVAIAKLSGDGNEHGAFGVDFREDKYGRPYITEINAGRFLTASYVYYYRCGYNLPRLLVELALGMDVTPLTDYPVGNAVIRQFDSEPYVGPLAEEMV